MRRALAVVIALLAVFCGIAALASWGIAGDARIGEDTSALVWRARLEATAALLLGTVAVAVWWWPELARRWRHERALLRAARSDRSPQG